MVISKAKLHKSHTNHTKSLWEWEQGYSVQELFKKQQENNKHPFMTIIDNPNLFVAVLKLYFCIWQNTLPVKKSSSSACEGLLQQHASGCHAWKVDRIDRLHQSRLFPEWDATLYYRNSPTALSLPGDPIWSKTYFLTLNVKKLVTDAVHGIYYSDMIASCNFQSCKSHFSRLLVKCFLATDTPDLRALALYMSWLFSSVSCFKIGKHLVIAFIQLHA